jgi:hypothetical protein
MSIRVSVGFNKQAHGACDGEKIPVVGSMEPAYLSSYSLFPSFISFPPTQMPSRGQHHWKTRSDKERVGGVVWEKAGQERGGRGGK